MANKVFNIGSSSSSTTLSNLEVYSDIDIVADINYAKKPFTQNINEYLAFLKSDECKNGSSTSDDTSYNLQIVVNGTDEDLIAEDGTNLISQTYSNVALFNRIVSEEMKRDGTTIEDKKKYSLILYYAGQNDYETALRIWATISRYKIEKDVNVRAVQNSLENIFNWIQGERILLPEFGSKLRLLLYEGITKQTEEQIIAEIHNCISQWEPRVQIYKVANVSIIDDTEDNTMHLQIIYGIPSLTDEQYTYSFQYRAAST